MEISRKFVQGVKKCRFLVILVFLLATLGFIYPVTQLISSTSLFFEAPEGSKAAIADAALTKHFPKIQNEGTTVILISVAKDSTLKSVLTNATKDFTLALDAHVKAYPSYSTDVTQFASYWTLVDLDDGMEASQMVSSNGLATIIQVNTVEVNTKLSREFVTYLTDFLEQSDLAKNPDYNLQRSGSDILMLDFFANILQEILVTDGISATLSLLVLLMLLGALTLMVVPLCNLIASVVISFGIVDLISMKWSVASFVPAVMIAIILAMTIDYSLFLLVRFRQELDRKNGKPTEEEFFDAVHKMVKYAGHVISVSGTTLMIAFLGLLFLGAPFIGTMGVACAVGLALTIGVNLTLGPALLFTFPNFFARGGILPCLGRRLSCCKSNIVAEDDNQESTHFDSSIAKSLWYRISYLITTREGAILVLILVVCALFPFMYNVKDFEYKTDNSLVFTDELASMKTIMDMQEYFPPGFVYPFNVIIEEKEPTENGTFCKEYFDAVPKFFDDIMTYTGGVDPVGIISAPLSYGIEFDWDTAQRLVTPTEDLYNTSYGGMFRNLLTMVLSDDHKGSRIMLMTNFDPTSSQAEDFIAKAREVSENYTANTRFTWHFTNILVDNVDLADAVFDSFPMMIGITLAVVFVFVGLSYRSIVLPIRLVLTIGVTVLWTYGIASVVFCQGALNWVFGEHFQTSGIYWVVPVVVMSVIIGLGIDYDVFLFSRITEARDAGFDTNSAIRFGYYKTGPIITGAGVVMALAFSGLMLSVQHILQQLGFFLAMSVLLDTFVIRMLAVPALLRLFGDANWWPHRVPKGTIHTPTITFEDTKKQNEDSSNIQNIEETPLLGEDNSASV